MTKIFNRFSENLICEESLLILRETAEKNKADLSEANLRGANLWGANLWGADLSEADLSEANLRGANLRGADLSEANLRGANFRGANLWGANLWGADLSEANFRGANLSEANLRGAKIVDSIIKNYKEASFIGNSRRQLRCFLLENGKFYFMVGCFSGYEKELKQRVIKKYGNNCEYMEAIKFLKRISKKYD